MKASVKTERRVPAVLLSFYFVVVKPHDTTVRPSSREMPFTRLLLGVKSPFIFV